MKYAIVGRTCSGKDTMIAMLEARGFKLARSYTTRPRRGPEDTRYEFLSPEEATAIPDDGKLLRTDFGGFEYFHDGKRVDESDMLLLDPPGLYGLLAACPGEAVEVVYMDSDYGTRKARAAARGTGDAFEARDAGEGARFDEFERDIDSSAENPLWTRIRNCTAVHRVSNAADDPDGLEAVADKLARWMTVRRRLETITRRAVDLGAMAMGDDGLLGLLRDDGTEVRVPPAVFAGIASYNNAAVGRLMLAWLSKEPRIYLDMPAS